MNLLTILIGISTVLAFLLLVFLIILLTTPPAPKNRRRVRDDIKKIIPHREPFLLIDKILGLDLDKEMIIGSRMISGDESSQPVCNTGAESVLKFRAGLLDVSASEGLEIHTTLAGSWGSCRLFPQTDIVTVVLQKE